MRSRRHTGTHVQKPRPRSFGERPISYVLESILCLGLLAATIHGFLTFVHGSDYFNVRSIRVEGAEILRKDTIVSQSGVTAGDCIFFLNPEAIAAEVRKLPFVSYCRITRTFPHDVTITIQERVPLATLLWNSRCFELDQDCNVLRELAPDQPHVGPFITQISDVGGVEVGKQLEHQAVQGAVRAWRAFMDTAMAKQVTVSEICAVRDSRICMYLDEFNCEIRWGRTDFEKQAKKLDVFWLSQNGKIPFREYVDLRFGDDVACR